MTFMMPRVILRGDGDSSIGLGHVFRLLALADILKEFFECVFIIRQPGESLSSLIESYCKLIGLNAINNHDEIDEISPLLFSTDIVVTDGYQFTSEYYESIKKKGCKIICVDDVYGHYFEADVVINHAPKTSFKHYNVGPFTQLCLGTAYALLREFFLRQAKEKRILKDANTVFICFGGSDSFNFTNRAVEAVLEVTQISKIIIVTGSAYLFLNELKKKIQVCSGKKEVNLYHNIDGEQILSLMIESQFAILPASTISLEAMCVGMGIIMGHYAENQKNIYQGCSKLNCCFPIGSYKSLTVKRLAGKIEEYIDSKLWNDHVVNQKNTMKGDSPQNITKVFTDLSREDGITLRKASSNDIITYFNWANDPEVRQNAINTDKIILENHRQWFEKRLQASEFIMYIFEFEDQLLGQVRFDEQKDAYVVDYSVDKKFRSQGFGKILLKMAMKQLSGEVQNPMKIKALVKEGNIASARTFQHLLFKSMKDILIQNIRYKQFLKVVPVKPRILATSIS